MKIASLLFLFAGCACAQGLEFIKANYTKYEYKIAMRDGVRLFTSVYIPKDASPALKYPILLDRNAPIALHPMASTCTKRRSGRMTCSAKRSTSSCTRTCAAR